MPAKLKVHAIEYTHNGRRYLLRLDAESFDDAQARIRSAHFNGEPLERVI